MSFRKWVGPALAFALLGAFAGTSNGCSSSGGGGAPADASPDTQVIHYPEAAPMQEAGMDTGGGMWDGTTGKMCATDTDCYGIGGPHLNKCSNDTFQIGEINPTPVCISPQCDPCGGTNPCDSYLHQCDGADMSAATPGLCIQTTATKTPGQGICLPRCSFADDGTAPSGCLGKDVCNPAGYGLQGSMAFGDGYCQGGCLADADCAPQVCDTSSGICVKTKPTYTKKLGDPCTGSADKTCYCPWNSAWVCTQFCITPAAGSPDPCGAGFACSALEPSTFTFAGSDASMPGFQHQNAGMAGFCLPTCQPTGAGEAGVSEAGVSEAGVSDASGVEAGVSEAGSGGCLAGTTCQSLFAGTPPVCAPPQ